MDLERHAGLAFGNVIITEQIIYEGTINGNAVVEAGAILDLQGTVTKDLTIMPGARVKMHGTVGGSIFNKGGELTVYGNVGQVVHRLGGQTIIAPEAEGRVRAW